MDGYWYCPHCKQCYGDDELESICVYKGNRWNPPEYENCCPHCGADSGDSEEACLCDKCGEICRTVDENFLCADCAEDSEVEYAV